MRRKKRRWLRWGVALLIITALLSYGGYRYLLNRRVMGWRQEGIAASQAHNHERAADLLGRYLQRSPRDAEALEYYITSREAAELPNGQHFAYAIAGLKLLLGMEPDRLNDRRHLLELYMKLDRRPEALDTADAVLAANPNDLRALEVKTEVLTRLHQEREALAVAKKWSAAAPSSLAAHMALLSLGRAINQSAESIVAAAQKLREAHPADPQFELLQGYAYALANDHDQAAQWLKLAAKHPGLNDDFARTLVAQFDALGMSDDSLTVLDDQVKNGGGKELRHLLGRRLWQLGRWEPTVAMLADLDPADPQSDATLVAFRAMALANLGKTDEASACRAALANRKQSAARAWVILLNQIIDAAPVDDKALVADCQSALSIDPQNPYLRYYLGEAEARLGESGLAIQAWRVATARDVTWGAPAVRLVEALLQKGRPEEAMEIATGVTRRNPTSAAAFIALSRAWAANVETGGMGRADDLLKLVTEVQRQLPGEDRTLLIQIDLTAQKGKKQDAVQIGRQAIARTPPPDEQFLLSLATVSLRYDLGLEQDCYTRSEETHGLTPTLAYARAITRAISGQAEAGLKLLDDLAQRTGKSGDPAWRLARARYLDITVNPGAKDAWFALGDAFPNDLDVQKAAVSARAVPRGDWDFMQRAIDRLHALTGETGAEWRLARARLLIDSPRTEADYERGVLLNELIREYGMLPEPHVLLASALVHMKRVDGAIEHLSVALQLDPTSVPIALQLVSLLQSRGDFDRVQQELDRITPFVRTPEQRRQAALLLAQQGEVDRPIQLLTTRPADDTPGTRAPDEDLLLAILYRRRHEPEKAEAVVRRLLEHPDVATVQFAASLFASQGRLADAEQVLSRLDSMKIEPGIKELVLGSFYAEIGQVADAARHYRLATEQSPANPAAWRVLAACQLALGAPADAIATINDAVKAVPTDAGLTKIQQQATLIRDACADAALRPLVASVIRDPLDADASLDLLRVLVEARGSGDVERLAGRLQQLAERRPDSLPIRMQLARCYQSMGRTADAVSTARRAMTTFPTNAEPARVTAALAGPSGRWADLAAAAQAWKKRTPDEEAAADTALAQAQVGLRQYDAALRDLEPYLPAAKASPDANADLLMTYAVALLKADRASEAADLIWALTEKAGPWRVRWMQIALEAPEKAESVKWLDRIAAAVPADAVQGRIALAESRDRLGRRTNDPQLIQAAWQDLKQVAADPATGLLGTLAAAAQAERIGDSAAAEGLYRRALATDPNVWVAQNNLAMLILKRGGDIQEATTLASAAVKLQPQQGALYDTLAQAQSKSGNPKAAAATMRTAIEVDPDNPQWRVLLAQYLLDSGDVAEAGKALNAMESAKLDLRSLPPTVRQQLQIIRKGVTGPARM